MHGQKEKVQNLSIQKIFVHATEMEQLVERLHGQRRACFPAPAQDNCSLTAIQSLHTPHHQTIHQMPSYQVDNEEYHQCHQILYRTVNLPEICW